VRELVLSASGVTLADAYTAGGEVLMGTLRWEKERDDFKAQAKADQTMRLQQQVLEKEAAELAIRIKALQLELASKQAEKTALGEAVTQHARELSQSQIRLRSLRKADESKLKDP
jgi:circadian clock protein KaiC